MNAIHYLTSLVAKKTRYVCGLVVMVLPLALIGCGSELSSASTASPAPTASSLRTAVPSVSPTAIPTSSPTVVPSPLPPTTVSPSPVVVLPEVSPPPDGWIAYRTPEGRLALVSPDGSQRVCCLTWTSQQGELLGYVWSPDGRRIALTLGSYYTPLALISLEDSHFTTLAPPGAVDPSFTWSQDGRYLAYLWRTDPQEERPPLALRVMDLTTGEMVTVTTFSNQLLPDPEVPALCPQAFPYPLLPVCMGPGVCVLNIWDVQTGQKVATPGVISLGREYVWLPGGEGLFLTKAKAGEVIKREDVEDETIRMTDLAFWRRGDEAPRVVLQASKRQSYEPVQWLSDGRLVVRVMEWEKDEYDGPAEPERVEYRLFAVDEAGGIREAEGGWPWWAADGFLKRLAWVATGLPEGDRIPRGRLGEWEVGPDGVTVIFTWHWFEGDEFMSAIYLWRGEGEPMRLAMGTGPQWQPKQPQP